MPIHRHEIEQMIEARAKKLIDRRLAQMLERMAAATDAGFGPYYVATDLLWLPWPEDDDPS